MTFRHQASTTGMRTCPACQTSAPAEVQIALKTGEELVMASCPRCETRIWTLDGRQVSVAEVLRAAAGDPDFEPGKSRSHRRR
jgi:uncharacterized paraquat-inducible protein A